MLNRIDTQDTVSDKISTAILVSIELSVFHNFQQVEYVSCQMVAGADRSHRACVEAFGVPWNEILQCVQSEFATSQQLEFEQSTAPALALTNWVPTIAYNGKVTEISHTGNAPPLKNILCDLIYNTNLACRKF
jgi:hypothetical protein